MTLPDLAAIVREAPPEALPALCGRLREAELLAEMRLRETPGSAPGANGHEPDENLSVKEAARRLGVSEDWLYKTKLPFKVQIGRRVLFSAKGLERWNRQRQDQS